MANQGLWMNTDGYYRRGSPHRYPTNKERAQRHVHQPAFQPKVNPNISNNNQSSVRHSEHTQGGAFQRNPQHEAHKHHPSDPSEKCVCCPFGYHIDLDFMRICDELSSGVNLREIKKPSKSRSRRKYGSSSGDPVSPPIPTRSSSIQLERNMKSDSPPKEKKEDDTQVDDIFAKENQEFWDIYNQFDKHLKTTYTKQYPKSRQHRIPSDTQSLPPDPADMQLSDVESVCSEAPSSSRRHPASEARSLIGAPRSHQGFHREYHRQEPMRINLRDMADLSGSNTSLSSTCSSNRFSPLPFTGAYSSLPNVHTDDSSTASGRSTPSSMMSASTLTVIRQQMASALVRMKRMEDQVKLIPTLQIKINVLKEEKRLLKMQIQRKEESERSRQSKAQLDAGDLLLQRERELEIRGEGFQQKEHVLQQKEMDLHRWNADLVQQEAEMSQREADLQRREADLERTLENERLEVNSDHTASLMTSTNHNRPSTLEELAEKLNKLKSMPPPVAPKPLSKTPLRSKAVVQPYIHTRTIGVHVDTLKRDVKDVGVSVNSDFRTEGMSFRPINVTMWKPNSLSEIPVSKSTQTDSDDTSDISVEETITISDESVTHVSPQIISIPQNIGTQTCQLEEKLETDLTEMSTQTIPEKVPLIESRTLETQTEDLSVELSDALAQTEMEPVITYDRGTFTVVEVSERSTAMDKREEHAGVYSRGTVTDVIQRRHMAVNTDVIEPKALNLLVLSEDIDITNARKVDTKDAWTKMENKASKNVVTETEKAVLRDIGAIVNVATETVCDTSDIGTSAQVQIENKSSLAMPEITEIGCGEDVQATVDASTATDTVQTTDSETCWDLSNVRTFSTNTDDVPTSDAASEASVSVKEQSSQVEEILDTKELAEVGIQTSRDVTERGFGDEDVNEVVCDRCSNVTHSEASVSVSESDFCKTRTIGTNHSVVTRSVGTGSFTVFENKYFIEDGESDIMCNACREKLDQQSHFAINKISVGVGGETTVEKEVYGAGENLARLPFRLESPNRSFPATNPKERRRPRSHSSPTINTAGFFTDQHIATQPSMKLSFPDPPDFTCIKWTAPQGTGTQERKEECAEKANNSSRGRISEGDDTSALEESTESIFRAEETVLRRNRQEPPEETKELASSSSSSSSGVSVSQLSAIDEDRPMAIAFSNPYFLPAEESPIDPVPKNGLDDNIKYNRQLSQDSSSAPQSTSHSLSSLASSSDSDSEASSSSEGSAFLSTTTEGSYDGRTGTVHVKRKRKISPKKKQKQFVFPQRIPLSPSSFQACQVIKRHCNQSAEFHDKDYMASLNSILREWFEISSQENSEVEHVQGYLTSLSDVSKVVLKKIINMADGNGNTALHYSISHGNFLIVNALLESAVCDVNKPNNTGATAIMLTALASIQEESDWRIVEKLFIGGDINIRASQAGQTALMLAVSRGKVRMVQLLLQAGADVNVQDKDGSTALMCASEHSHIDIVKLLISQPGCDININDNDGCNAISIAMENGHKAIGVLLYAHMKFGKQSSPKKRVSSGSPGTRNILNISSSHTSAFTPVSKSLTQDPPPSSDRLGHPARSRSLSPTSRQSSLHSLRMSKYQVPSSKGGHPSSAVAIPSSKGGHPSSAVATGRPSNHRLSAGNSNDFRHNGKNTGTPQTNFKRNTPLRKSGPARLRHMETSSIVSAIRKSSDPQSKYKSV